MAALTILKRTAVRELKSKLTTDKERLDVYRNGSLFPFINEEGLLKTTVDLPSAAPELTVDTATRQSRSADDAENAVKVFHYLGDLSRTQAADHRLWCTLTHTTFWEYTQARWPVGEREGDKAVSYITEHWLVHQTRGLASLRRNAISRLWWAAYLTWSPWHHDKELEVFKTADQAKYTKILLSQQQIYFDVIERSFGSNLALRICLLDALGEGLPKVKNKDALSREVAKEVNLLVRHRQLDSMAVPELREVLGDLVGRASKGPAMAEAAVPGPA